jgi:hypothetical protein
LLSSTIILSRTLLSRQKILLLASLPDDMLIIFQAFECWFL